MRILKVAHIVEPYPQAGGFATSIGTSARWLAARGHQVTVLSADHGSRAPFATDGVEFVYLPMIASYRRIGISPKVLRFADERMADYDVVHLYGTFDLISPAIARAARRRALPYIVEPQGSLPAVARGFIRKKIYAELIGKTVWRGAKAVLANSILEQERLRAMFPHKPVLLRRMSFPVAPVTIDPSEVDAFRQQVTSNSHRKIVLFLGRMAAVKRIDELVHACGRVKTPCVLVLAGPADGDDTLKRAIRTARAVGVSVHVLGPVTPARKWSLLAAADVVTLVSGSESFGLAAAEAMAVGTPVVVSRSCGIAEEIAQSGAGLVVSGDAASIAAAIELLLTDEARADAARTNGLTHARARASAAPMMELEAIYQSVGAANTQMPPASYA